MRPKRAYFNSFRSGSKRFGYGLLDIELSTNSSKISEWSFYAKRLKGLVGYGITIFPFPIDVKQRQDFDDRTIMVRSNSGFINGGKKSQQAKDRHTVLRWKKDDEIKCRFDPKNGSFSMKKVILFSR